MAKKSRPGKQRVKRTSAKQEPQKAKAVSSASSAKSAPIESYLVHLYLLVMLSLQFVPLLNALDSNITKWLMMILTNGAFWVLMLINRNKPGWQVNTAIFNQWNVWLFVALIAISVVSFVMAINYGEAFLGLMRYITMFSVLLSYMIILDKKPEILKFAAIVVVGLVLIDGYVYLTEYFEKVYGKGGNRVMAVRSFYNNKNQIALSLLIKAPFVMYLYLTSKKAYWRVPAALAMISNTIVWGLLLTRTAYLTLGTISVLLIVSYFIFIRQSSFRQTFHQGIVLFFVALLVGNMIAYGIQTTDYVPLAKNTARQSVAVKQKRNKNVKTIADRVDKDEFTRSPLRLFLWAKSLEIIRDYPVLGVGVNNWKVMFPKYDVGYYKGGNSAPRRAHSDPLQVMAELGIVGGLVFIGLFLINVFYFFRILRSDKVEKNYKLFSFLVMVGIIVYSIPSLLTFPLERANHQVYLMFFFAALAVFHQKYEERPALPKFPTSLVAVGLVGLAVFSLYVHWERFISYRIQNEILPDITSGAYRIPIKRVEECNRFFSSISADGTESLLSMKGRYLVQQKRWEEAEQTMLEALKTNPYFYKNHVLLALINHNMGNCEKTEEYARKVVRKRPLIDMYQLLIICAQKAGDKEKVTEILHELTTRNAEDARGWTSFADWYIKLNKPDSALYILEEAIRSGKVSRKQRSQLWEKRIVTSFNLKDYKAADSVASLMLQKYPKNINAHINRGSALVNLNRSNEALQHFDYVISRKPDNELARQNRGIAHYMLQNDQQALADFNHIIEQKKDAAPAPVFYFKGMAHHRLGQSDQACKAMQMAAQKRYPNSQQALNVLCR